MNRIAILLIVLIVAILAVLLLHRAQTGAADSLHPAEVRRQPEAALQQIDSLIEQAGQGLAAAEQTRHTVAAIIDNDPGSAEALSARLRLVQLERLLGNDEAARDALLDAVMAHPGSAETPRLLFDLGLLLAGPQDSPAEAAEIFSRVIDLYPNHPLTPEAAIRLALIRNQGDEALLLHRQMIANQETADE